MKKFLKHLIVGGILSTIIAVVAFILSHKGVTKLPFFLINIPVGTITYTIVKSWNTWLYEHFTFFGKNVVINYIFDFLVWPLVASGWWALFMMGANI